MASRGTRREETFSADQNGGTVANGAANIEEVNQIGGAAIAPPAACAPATAPGAGHGHGTPARGPGASSHSAPPTAAAQATRTSSGGANRSGDSAQRRAAAALSPPRIAGSLLWALLAVIGLLAGFGLTTARRRMKVLRR